MGCCGVGWKCAFESTHTHTHTHTHTQRGSDCDGMLWCRLKVCSWVDTHTQWGTWPSVRWGFCTGSGIGRDGVGTTAIWRSCLEQLAVETIKMCVQLWPQCVNTVLCVQLCVYSFTVCTVLCVKFCVYSITVCTVLCVQLWPKCVFVYDSVCTVLCVQFHSVYGSVRTVLCVQFCVYSSVCTVLCVQFHSVYRSVLQFHSVYSFTVFTVLCVKFHSVYGSGPKEHTKSFYRERNVWQWNSAVYFPSGSPDTCKTWKCLVDKAVCLRM